MQGIGLGDPRDKKNQAGYDTGVHKLLRNGGGGEMFTWALRQAVTNWPVVPLCQN